LVTDVLRIPRFSIKVGYMLIRCKVNFQWRCIQGRQHKLKGVTSTSTGVLGARNNLDDVTISATPSRTLAEKSVRTAKSGGGVHGEAERHSMARADGLVGRPSTWHVYFADHRQAKSINALENEQCSLACPVAAR
jgi:hypothetical protein